MNRVDIKKYQKAQLRLLEYFDRICTEMGLSYYLVFGTLLGAIRHEGFIPWDADIDVAMFRDDYEAFKERFINQPNDDLFYQHYDTEINHGSPHAVLKIRGTHVYYKKNTASKYQYQYDGIYIDIFPIDNVTENKKQQYAQVKRIAQIRRIVSLKKAPIYDNTTQIGIIAKKTISLILAPFSFHYLFKCADKIMKRYDCLKDTKYVAILTDPQVFQKQLFPREVFEKTAYATFEGHRFRIPEKADQFLSIRYGNYMELPPEKDRWTYLENSLLGVDYGETTFLSDLED